MNPTVRRLLEAVAVLLAIAAGWALTVYLDANLVR